MIDTRTEHLLVAEALVVPSGIEAGPLAVEPSGTRRVPGFVESAFSPLVKAAVDRCLADVVDGDTLGEPGARMGLVLVTFLGDTTTSDLGSRLLESGQVANPLLFYQSVPTTILGVIARDYAITGPTTCVALRGDVRSEALDLVDTVLDDGMDQVLLIAVELETAEGRPLAAHARLARDGEPLAAPSRTDAAVAFLFRRADTTPEGTGTAVPVSGPDPAADLSVFGSLAGLVQLYATVRAARAQDSTDAVDVDIESALGARQLRVRLEEAR
ncbi:MULTISPECIES: ketosynthase [Streptomyces]|uniref:ketosynthase n=1 Tax=Streptomyces TaxID=1883 RepID=UPI001E4904C3|nr:MULTISPECIES: ketosynthase [Streptomyces]UFQ17175.1 ketosynthase [Streptomyces huasconensis]WCL86775.1 ketosynthase [Streptomyces sp. JCM 35825]